jgi:hypothetical protein
MKKVTRLLILTAFVLPVLMASRAYAGGPRPGQRSYFERDRQGLDPTGTQRPDPYNTDLRNTDGFHATDLDNNPLHLQDQIGDPVPDMNRNDLYNRSVSHGDAGQPVWNPGNGGGTAPIDGGISLLLAAGIGLGIKRARARKQTV